MTIQTEVSDNKFGFIFDNVETKKFDTNNTVSDFLTIYQEKLEKNDKTDSIFPIVLFSSIFYIMWLLFFTQTSFISTISYMGLLIAIIFAGGSYAMNPYSFNIVQQFFLSKKFLTSYKAKELEVLNNQELNNMIDSTEILAINLSRYLDSDKKKVEQFIHSFQSNIHSINNPTLSHKKAFYMAQLYNLNKDITSFINQKETKQLSQDNFNDKKQNIKSRL